ncbi:MAG: fused MFS/spermidine synthase [Gemmataceae bacterium]|nr:fused MFS/spermidine synthase [Gemmataceae bacterium]MCI0742000.1 fused MFS/spermidine synthase [Gemmataceae bacterium]
MLFALTAFLSAFLLFWVQLLSAKMLLPALGGAPAVWIACMVFFQAGLLAGYANAHWGPNRLGLRVHALIQLGLFGLAFALLPIALGEDAPVGEPFPWIMATLTIWVGLPFFVVASMAPLLQRWFHLAYPERNPFALYAASNLGSFAALVLFPFVIEPGLNLEEQSEVWRGGFAALACASAACAWLALRGRNGRTELHAPGFSRGGEVQVNSPRPQVGEGQVNSPRPRGGEGWGVRGRWLLLALAPSSLLLSVTSYLTTDIAAVPLLWVIPLAIYLLSFSIVFSAHGLKAHWLLARWTPAVILILLILLFTEATEPVGLVMGLHLLGLFWLALLCHGELVRTKPDPRHLSSFYLWIALGGALGGLFNSLVAPWLFPSFTEYPLILILVAWLRPTHLEVGNVVGTLRVPSADNGTRSVPATLLPADLIWAVLPGIAAALLVWLIQGRNWIDPGPVQAAALFGGPLVLAFLSSERPVRFAIGLAGILVASGFYHGVHGRTAFQKRSFFGVHRVTEQDGFRQLIHGNTIHGKQSLDPARRDEPLTYYTRTGPIGQLLGKLRGDARLRRVGLVGLGTGAMASYPTMGERWTYFEIDPTVVHIARDSGLFTYLQEKEDRVGIVLGDARLRLEESQETFGVLVIDAFGSDAIPVHLLTREALSIYMDRLEENGILVFHISNRYLDLEPVLANLAHGRSPQLYCAVNEDLSVSAAEIKAGKSASVWLAMARPGANLPQLLSAYWRPARGRPDLPVWTDRYSNLFAVFRWSHSN